MAHRAKCFIEWTMFFYLFFIYLCFASYVDSLRVERFIERTRRKRTVISFLAFPRRLSPNSAFIFLLAISYTDSKCYLIN